MPGISAATMARLRAVDETFMPSTCRVLRPTTAVVSGRTVHGGEAELASVACRATGLGTAPREGMAAGRMEAEVDGAIALPVGTDVESGDRIEVTSGGSTVTFEVVGDPWPDSYATSLLFRVKHEG